MKRIPLGWSVIAVLLGCGLILFAGGKNDSIEEWEPLNVEIAEALGVKNDQRGSTSTLPEMNNPEQVKDHASSKEQIPVKEASSESASPNSETVAQETVITEVTSTSPDAGNPPQEQVEQTASADTNGKINVNTADISSLMDLPGIGEKKAQAIIDYRTKNGPFRSVAELMDVKGIGPKMLEKMKPYVAL